MKCILCLIMAGQQIKEIDAPICGVHEGREKCVQNFGLMNLNRLSS